MNDNIICRAEIKAKPRTSSYITVLIIVLVSILLLLPISSEKKYELRNYRKIETTISYNIIHVPIYQNTVVENNNKFEVTGAFYAFIILLVFSITFYSLYIATNISYSKQCKLELTDKIVNGVVKKSRINHRLNIPLDKIDNIEIIDLNSFFTGKTIAIRSASGLVKIPWVQNAYEFVNATLAKIEEYKQQVKEENKSLVKTTAESAAAAAKLEASQTSASKIKELKDLLDNDLISKEEFESKRRDLLDKM